MSKNNSAQSSEYRQLALELFITESHEKPRSNCKQRPSDFSKSSPQQDLWTTEQVVRLLKLSDARPLYRAREQNQFYWQGTWLVVPTGKRNRWALFGQAIPQPHPLSDKV